MRNARTLDDLDNEKCQRGDDQQGGRDARLSRRSRDATAFDGNAGVEALPKIRGWRDGGRRMQGEDGLADRRIVATTHRTVCHMPREPTQVPGRGNQPVPKIAVPLEEFPAVHG